VTDARHRYREQRRWRRVPPRRHALPSDRREARACAHVVLACALQKRDGMKIITDEIRLSELDRVTGGKKIPSDAVPFPGGGWEQDRSKGGDLQVRWISPLGKRGPWITQ
jgi:hypothetical protein